MTDNQYKINQLLDKPETLLKRQVFFTSANELREEIKTESLVTNPGFDFKIEKITVGYKAQLQFAKKPPI